MRKLGLFIIALALTLASPGSAQTPEALKSFTDAAFGTLLARRKTAFNAQSYVHLSGDVDLRGSTYVRDDGGFVSVNLSGSARLHGSDGVTADQSFVNQHVSFYLRKDQNHVSEYVNVSQHVNVYKNGRYVGSTNVSGGVRVSGWKSGNWLSLDGRGTLSGGVFVSDDQVQARRPRRR